MEILEGFGCSQAGMGRASQQRILTTWAQEHFATLMSVDAGCLQMIGFCFHLCLTQCHNLFEVKVVI